MANKFTMERFEDDEWVILVEGMIIGETLTKRRAESILLWLKTTNLSIGFENKDALRSDKE